MPDDAEELPSEDEDKPQDGNNSPELKPAKPLGFEIEANADGLIIEGLKNEYELSRQMKAVDLSCLHLLVFTAVNGEKGTEIPAENYQLTLYYGSTKQENTQNLTLDGAYVLTVALKGCCRADGDKIADGEFYASVNFEIKNPLTELFFVSGKNVQTSSAIDKLSTYWQFEAERANGYRETVPAEKISLAPLNTLEVGIHSVTAEFGGLVTEVQYEITPRTVINSVNVKLKDDVATEITGEYLALESGDIEVEISADGSYFAEKKIYYENAEVQTLKLAPQDNAHEVTVEVIIEYFVDGEKETVTHRETLEIFVTQKLVNPPEQPAVPQTKFEGEELKKLLDGESGPITVEAESNYEITADENGLTVKQTKLGDQFDGVKFKLDGAATVKIKLYSATAMACVENKNEEWVVDPEFFDGERLFEFAIPEGGEYRLILLLLADETPSAVIGSIEIVYP